MPLSYHLALRSRVTPVYVDTFHGVCGRTVYTFAKDRKMRRGDKKTSDMAMIMYIESSKEFTLLYSPLDKADFQVSKSLPISDLPIAAGDLRAAGF